MLQNLRARALPPGLVIGEAAVAVLFGVSRAPAQAALERLAAEGMLRTGPKRGFLVGPGSSRPVRQDLVAAGLKLPADIKETIAGRGLRAQLYPRVEREIAACLPYGRFQINEVGLAQEYGISRTIAHEFLVRLERLDIVRQHGSRWLAVKLTADRLQEHYEMRWLLEPVALRQAAPFVQTHIEIAYRRALRTRAASRRPDRQRLQLLERDLHTDIVMRAGNREMVAAIYRSQLPLMATNDTFLRRVSVREPQKMIDEHLAVLEPLRTGAFGDAAAALTAHLRSACATLLWRFEHITHDSFVPPAYMKLAPE